uniref:Uncharacterized protein n=1 Tax=Rhizophora mucronata TaxID=61149 RepID=A0A2P2MAI0_RHIMU
MTVSGCLLLHFKLLFFFISYLISKIFFQFLL